MCPPPPLGFIGLRKVMSQFPNMLNTNSSLSANFFFSNISYIVAKRKKEKRFQLRFEMDMWWMCIWSTYYYRNRLMYPGFWCTGIHSIKICYNVHGASCYTVSLLLYRFSRSISQICHSIWWRSYSNSRNKSGSWNSLFKFVFRSFKFALRSRNLLAFTSFKLKYATRAFKFATVPGSVFSSIQIRTWAFKFVIRSFSLACILRMRICIHLLKQNV